MYEKYKFHPVLFSIFLRAAYPKQNKNSFTKKIRVADWSQPRNCKQTKVEMPAWYSKMQVYEHPADNEHSD